MWSFHPLFLPLGTRERGWGARQPLLLPLSSSLSSFHICVSLCLKVLLFFVGFFFFPDYCSFLCGTDPWIFLDCHDFCWKTLTAETPPTFIYIEICFFSSAFLLQQGSVELLGLIISGILPIKMCNPSKGWKWQWICLLPSNWGFHLNPVVLETSEFHWTYTYHNG